MTAKAGVSRPKPKKKKMVSGKLILSNRKQAKIIAARKKKQKTK